MTQIHIMIDYQSITSGQVTPYVWYYVPGAKHYVAFSSSNKYWYAICVDTHLTDPELTVAIQQYCGGSWDAHWTALHRVGNFVKLCAKYGAQFFAAGRDANGSLICQSCGEPYPYAEPDEDGSFVCRSCKSYKEMCNE